MGRFEGCFGKADGLLGEGLGELDEGYVVGEKETVEGWVDVDLARRCTGCEVIVDNFSVRKVRMRFGAQLLIWKLTKILKTILLHRTQSLLAGLVRSKKRSTETGNCF